MTTMPQDLIINLITAKVPGEVEMNEPVEKHLQRKEVNDFSVLFQSSMGSPLFFLYSKYFCMTHKAQSKRWK